MHITHQEALLKASSAQNNARTLPLATLSAQRSAFDRGTFGKSGCCCSSSRFGVQVGESSSVDMSDVSTTTRLFSDRVDSSPRSHSSGRSESFGSVFNYSNQSVFSPNWGEPNTRNISTVHQSESLNTFSDSGNSSCNCAFYRTVCECVRKNVVMCRNCGSLHLNKEVESYASCSCSPMTPTNVRSCNYRGAYQSNPISMSYNSSIPELNVGDSDNNSPLFCPNHFGDANNFSIDSTASTNSSRINNSPCIRHCSNQSQINPNQSLLDSSNTCSNSSRCFHNCQQSRVYNNRFESQMGSSNTPMDCSSESNLPSSNSSCQVNVRDAFPFDICPNNVQHNFDTSSCRHGRSVSPFDTTCSGKTCQNSRVSPHTRSVSPFEDVESRMESLTYEVMEYVRLPMFTPRQLADLLLMPLTIKYKEFFVLRMSVAMAFHSGQWGRVEEVS